MESRSKPYRGRAVIAVLFFLLITLRSPFPSGARDSGEENCAIEDITIQSFFAIDGFYEMGDDGGKMGEEIVRNKVAFLSDINNFFYLMETSKKGVDSSNGIFAFGDSIKKLKNFNDDTEGRIDLGEIKTTVGEKKVIDALEEIIDEFDDIPVPKTDYVRLGILMTSRPLYFSANNRGGKKDDDDDDDDKDENRLAAILSTIKKEKIVMYAIGKDSNRADLVKIAGSENRVILNNFTDSEWMDVGSKLKTSLCKSINENKILAALTIGAGAILGIIIAVIVAAIIIYVIKKHAYDKYQLQKLAEAKENMKNKSEANRLYKDPVTKTDLAELGIATN